MFKHHGSTEQHGCGVGCVLKGQVQTCVSCPLLKQDVLMSNIPPRADPSATNQTSTYVADNIAIEIGHHHHVKLVGIGDQLQGGKSGRNHELAFQENYVLTNSGFCCKNFALSSIWSSQNA